VSNSALATAQNPQGTDITDISGTTISTDDSTIVDISPKPSIAADRYMLIRMVMESQT
jgi:hypothetical protein